MSCANLHNNKKRAKDRDNRFVRAAFLSHVIFPGTFSHVFFFKPRKTTLLRKSVTHVLSRNDFIFLLFYFFVVVFSFSFFFNEFAKFDFRG